MIPLPKILCIRTTAPMLAAAQTLAWLTLESGHLALSGQIFGLFIISFEAGSPVRINCASTPSGEPHR